MEELKTPVCPPPPAACHAIRRPLPEDWPQVLRLLEVYNFHRIGGPEMPAFPLSDCYVAVADGRVVGVSGYQVLDATTAKNSLTAVDPACRCQGIGTSLKNVCMDHLRSLGIKTLYTNCDDPVVIAWNIRRFGFRPTGKTIPKVESYGRNDKDHWVNLVAYL